jgi:hypothetical protein
LVLGGGCHHCSSWVEMAAPGWGATWGCPSADGDGDRGEVGIAGKAQRAQPVEPFALGL